MIDTVAVAFVLVAVSVLIAVPTPYVGRSLSSMHLTMLLFMLPILVPPITYGIPLATVLYKVTLAL